MLLDIFVLTCFPGFIENIVFQENSRGCVQNLANGLDARSHLLYLGGSRNRRRPRISSLTPTAVNALWELPHRPLISNHFVSHPSAAPQLRPERERQFSDHDLTGQPCLTCI